jgi:ubiquinone/menaquinone biosynthesis C-methylase UbiE
VNQEQSTRQWYAGYYPKKGGTYRNDLRVNPGVLFQFLAAEASLVRAARGMDHEPRSATVLDVGCGSGGDLFELFRLGYSPENTVGIDILPERIAEARRLHPNVRFVDGDASHMEFPDGSFDLVFESTMFATLPDDRLSAAIGAEMVRVCRPGGYLVLVDWRTPKPGDRTYNALTGRRLQALFGVGRDTQWLSTHRGALVPPLGRFLSKWCPSAYFLVSAVLPFLCGQVTFVLRRTAAPASPSLCCLSLRESSVGQRGPTA